MSRSLLDLIVELEENAALEKVKEAVAEGKDPLAIVEECRQGLQVVGERYDQGEYFLSELIVGAEIFKQAVASLSPAILGGRADASRLGKVVVGTVRGDIHDLGKNVVIALLSASGFEVHDLGVDVPVERFVEKVREVQPSVVAMSALLTLSFDAMKETIQALADAGLRKELGIMIGGGPVDENVREYVGADEYGRNAAQAVVIAKRLAGVL